MCHCGVLSTAHRVPHPARQKAAVRPGHPPSDGVGEVNDVAPMDADQLDSSQPFLPLLTWCSHTATVESDGRGASDRALRAMAGCPARRARPRTDPGAHRTPGSGQSRRRRTGWRGSVRVADRRWARVSRVFHPTRPRGDHPAGGRQQTHRPPTSEPRCGWRAACRSSRYEEENCDRPVRCGRTSQDP